MAFMVPLSDIGPPLLPAAVTLIRLSVSILTPVPRPEWLV